TTTSARAVPWRETTRHPDGRSARMPAQAAAAPTRMTGITTSQRHGFTNQKLLAKSAHLNCSRDGTTPPSREDGRNLTDRTYVRYSHPPFERYESGGQTWLMKTGSLNQRVDQHRAWESVATQISMRASSRPCSGSGIAGRSERRTPTPSPAAAASPTT